MNDIPEEHPANPSPRRQGAPVLAIVAIGLSLSALAVSMFEVSAIRDEQRIQVWPYVQVTEHYDSEGFALNLSNKGIGPARIRTMAVRYKGEEYTDLDQLIIDSIGQENAFSYDLYRSSNPTRSVLSPDEQVTVFGVPWEPRTRMLTKEWSQTVVLEVCYCSVYDDCWLTKSGGEEPQPTGSCDSP